MSRLLEAPVIGVEAFALGNSLLALEAPEIAGPCKPGQFVMISAQTGLSQPFPLLKRALAVYSTDYGRRKGSVVSLLLKAVGDGTRQLAALRPGDRAELVGPLGNGFDVDEVRSRRVFLVAGGIGIASFYLLARDLAESGKQVHLIYGARSSRDLVGIEDFEALGLEITVTTDDGSRGIQGLVLSGLEKAAAGCGSDDSIFYACGPTPMMQAVAAWCAKRGAPCRISVENRMACGFGVCLGCTVRTADGYRLACTHGPVFDAARFEWPPS